MTFEARLPSISDAIAIRLDFRDERVPSRGIELSLKAWRCLSVASLYDCNSGEAETSKLVRLVSMYLRVYERYTSSQRSFSRIHRTMELLPHWPSLRRCELGSSMLLPWSRVMEDVFTAEAKMGQRWGKDTYVQYLGGFLSIWSRAGYGGPPANDKRPGNEEKSPELSAVELVGCLVQYIE